MRTIYGIVIFLAIIALGAAGYFSYFKMSCQAQYQDIENDLKQGNYCMTNDDCTTILLGGDYIKFGCYHYINKAVDQNTIFSKMDTYNAKCSTMINDCMRAPNPVCVQNKCTEP